MRTFAHASAVKEHVPLFVGIFGPSGSGKTYSALRLATGIQRVSGGEIFVVDTESKRACHYADRFKFQHVDFKAPFGSLDYLEAIRYCVSKGAGAIVIDSFSHEHEADGGYLMTHTAEMERMGNNDKNKFSAWIKPSRERRQLINGMLQLNTNIIFCFRAKEKMKIRPGQQPQELGWMPIAGEEFLFEMTATVMLYPNASGVPTWGPTLAGEQIMCKLPQQFVGVLNDGKPMSEEHGEKLARWARGAPEEPPPSQERIEALKEMARDHAEKGLAPLTAFFNGLKKSEKEAIKNYVGTVLKPIAVAFDSALAAST